MINFQSSAGRVDIRAHRGRVPCDAGIALCASLLALVAGCATHPGARAHRPSFVLGADISALDAPWRPGPAGPRVYRDNGVPSDELTILRNHGWTAFRVRVFVAPVRKAPNNTLEAAIPLAKRIKAANATLLLDIHLSDTWADPGHQETPVAWRGLDINGMEAQVEAYCYDTVKRLKDAGAMPDWVQVGNEITRGTLWPLAELKVRWASSSRCCPSPVRIIPFALRSKRAMPSSSSSALICALMAGWLVARDLAARERLPSLATATKVRSW